MLIFEVCYFNHDNDEVTVEMEAEDAAAALGMVLDECEDDIAEGSPFVVDLAYEDEDDGDDGEPSVEPVIEKVEVAQGAKVIQLFKKVGT